jgi:hypothetical protein
VFPKILTALKRLLAFAVAHTALRRKRKPLVDEMPVSADKFAAVNVLKVPEKPAPLSRS